MQSGNVTGSSILGICLLIGLGVLGFQLGDAVIKFKAFERTVAVKGLSEKEMPADIVLWPIQHTAANNDLNTLYSDLENEGNKISEFLKSNGLKAEEISVSPPAITDKLAQQYGSGSAIELRYTASQTVTVYSEKIETVRSMMNKITELGKEGIVFSGENYENKTDYIFTRLNDIKPAMIEEATRKAREVAEKFAKDSDSRLGKIKKAYQGQFTVEDRDKNNPHIKKIRVVSTVEYYLSD
jgi:hypothetical protein